jgi:hypothetical protein
MLADQSTDAKAPLDLGIRHPDAKELLSGDDSVRLSGDPCERAFYRPI